MKTDLSRRSAAETDVEKDKIGILRYLVIWSKTTAMFCVIKLFSIFTKSRLPHREVYPMKCEAIFNRE